MELNLFIITLKPEARASGFAIAVSISHQRLTHCRACVRFGHGIEVAVNISGGAHIAMPQPFPDLLHWHVLGKKHRGAGVAKIVEADLLQVMLIQKLSEVSGDEVGNVQLTECIHTDVVGVFLGVRRALRLFDLLLLFVVEMRSTNTISNIAYTQNGTPFCVPFCYSFHYL